MSYLEGVLLVLLFVLALVGIVGIVITPYMILCLQVDTRLIGIRFGKSKDWYNNQIWVHELTAFEVFRYRLKFKRFKLLFAIYLIILIVPLFM